MLWPMVASDFPCSSGMIGLETQDWAHPAAAIRELTWQPIHVLPVHRSNEWRIVQAVGVAVHFDVQLSRLVAAARVQPFEFLHAERLHAPGCDACIRLAGLVHRHVARMADVLAVLFDQEWLQFLQTTARNDGAHHRSEERRVGKECRSRWSPY